MKRVLITGGRGFLGRNLAAHLSERKDCITAIVDREDSDGDVKRHLSEADVIFHLAGVNRPQDLAEFEVGNSVLTDEMCEFLRQNGHSPKIIFSSSIQAELDNPYGASKAKAEFILRRYAEETGASVSIYRLKNLFGKWCRPNYNSVVATFCHNIANDISIEISDPLHEVDLSYVDDVVATFLSEIDGGSDRVTGEFPIPSYRIQLGDLAGRIQAFHDMRPSLTLPDIGERFNRALYATYLSYVDPAHLHHDLVVKSDERGSLAEFIKQKSFGQIFVSRTKPGVTRGNHYHHTKAEKFFVIEGDGLIRLRHLQGGPVAEYFVKGSAYQVIDIPVSYTHLTLPTILRV